MTNFAAFSMSEEPMKPSPSKSKNMVIFFRKELKPPKQVKCNNTFCMKQQKEKCNNNHPTPLQIKRKTHPLLDVIFLFFLVQFNAWNPGNTAYLDSKIEVNK